MRNYQLENDEAIIYEGKVIFGRKENVMFTLTSKRMIFEVEKGLFKKKLRIIDEVFLEKIVLYKNKVQIKQIKSTLKIQTIDKKILLTCINMFDATKIREEIIKIKTGSNVVERTTNKMKSVVGQSVKFLTRGVVITKGVIYAIENFDVLKKNMKKIAKSVLHLIKK